MQKVIEQLKEVLKDKDDLCDEAITRMKKAEARVVKLEKILSRLSEWTHEYGKNLCPRMGEADSYGDGVRSCKTQVASIINFPEFNRTKTKEFENV